MGGQVAYLQDELFTSLKRESFHGNVNEILGVGILNASYYGLEQSQGTWCIVSSNP